MNIGIGNNGSLFRLQGTGKKDSIQAGQVLKGTVIDVPANQSEPVTIQSGDRTFKAVVTTPVKPGESGYFQVQPDSTQERLVLKPVPQPSSPPNDKSAPLIQGSSLPDTPETREWAQAMRKLTSPAEMPALQGKIRELLNGPEGAQVKRTDEALTRFLNTTLTAQGRGLPLTPLVVSALNEAMFGPTLAETTGKLLQLLETSGRLDPQTSKILDHRTPGEGQPQTDQGEDAPVAQAVRVLKQVQSVLQGTVQVKPLTVAVSPTNHPLPNGSASDANGTQTGIRQIQTQPAGSITLDGQPNGSVTPDSPVDLTPGSSNTGRLDVLNNPNRNPGSNAIGQTAAGSTTPHPANLSQSTNVPSATNPLNEANSVNAANRLNVANPINPAYPLNPTQTTGLPMAQTEVQRGISGQSQGQSMGAGPAGNQPITSTNQTALPIASSNPQENSRSPLINQLPLSHHPTMKSGSGGNSSFQQIDAGFEITGQPAAHSDPKMVRIPDKQQIQGWFQLIGLMHEKNMHRRGLFQPTGQDPGIPNPLDPNAETQQSLKRAMLQLLASDEVDERVKVLAEQVSNQLTGQQLLLHNDRINVNQMSFWIPVWQEGQQDQVAVHVETQSNKKGEWDADNCRIWFDLSMKQIGLTLVDVQIAQRVVQIHLHNDYEPLQQWLETAKPELDHKLQEMGYHLSILKQLPYPSLRLAEHASDASSTSRGGSGEQASRTTANPAAAYRNKPYQGVDFRA